jgi:N-acyl-D-amino-acid deacylase
MTRSPIVPNAVRTTIFVLLATVPWAGGSTSSPAPKRPFSLVIINGSLVTGDGRPAVRADVRVEGDRIVGIGRFFPQPGEDVIDARGLIVAPGFIDLHNHSEQGLESDPTAVSQISQGITTLVVGQDGRSPWPIGEFLAERERRPAAVNVITLVGHATLRQRVMGEQTSRPATESEIAAMADLVEQGMREGAFGLSTGLEYDVGHPSTTEEVIALARRAARAGGIYVSHIRDEGDRVFEALAEALRIGREADIPVHISHIKLATVGVWGKARRAVTLIARARNDGRDITADAYPYEAWASTITVLVPSRRHTDRAAVARGIADVGGAANVLVTRCPARPQYEGKTLREIARQYRTTPVDVYMEIVREGGAGVVCRSMRESDIRVFYRQPWVMVASDGGIGMRHPRATGAFPRVLGEYVRTRRWLRLEEAIRKMTSAPAARLGLKDRGLIAEGMKADLVIFDPERVNDRSTFRQPHLLSVGIEYVLVNGVRVWEHDHATGALPGVVIRKNLPQ